MSDDADREIEVLERRLRTLELAIMHTRKVLAVLMSHIPVAYEGLKERVSVLRDELKDVLRGTGR